jgi:hypothetical protein
VKVWILGSDPVEKPADPWIRPDRGYTVAKKTKLGIRKGSVQGAMADWMDWHDLAPAAAFGNRVMKFYGAPERA